MKHMCGRHVSSISDPIKLESGVHGARWNNLHGGYFTDCAVAKPFLDIVQDTVDSSNPDVVVDIGGGTGFVLEELVARSISPGIRLVNLDLSRKQLAESYNGRIMQIRLPMNEFRREHISGSQGRFIFIMRSVLHYCGKHGLPPFLRYLRSQMKRNEFFVHQTACFDLARDARCLNKLYELMGTGKWYPTAKSLGRLLERAGWSVKSVAPARPLLLTSSELGRRYRLHKSRLQLMRDELSEHFGEKENVFEIMPDGFRAYLHYRIFTCCAR